MHLKIRQGLMPCNMQMALLIKIVAIPPKIIFICILYHNFRKCIEQCNHSRLTKWQIGEQNLPNILKFSK